MFAGASFFDCILAMWKALKSTLSSETARDAYGGYRTDIACDSSCLPQHVSRAWERVTWTLRTLTDI